MKRLNDEEAIKRLKEARSTIQPYQYVNEAIDYAIQALEQQASEKEHKIGVTYICDGKKCQECSKLCRHTTDISHAKNFKPVMFIDGKTVLDYEEVENEYKGID